MPVDRMPPAVILPELEGEVHRYADGDVYDGRYRLYTPASGVPFSAFPAWIDGGPATVALNDWCMSTTSWSYSAPERESVPESVDRAAVTLNAVRGVLSDACEKHPLDGTRYATVADANRAAYAAGLIAFMVYEKHAARYGLPTTD